MATLHARYKIYCATLEQMNWVKPDKQMPIVMISIARSSFHNYTPVIYSIRKYVVPQR